MAAPPVRRYTVEDAVAAAMLSPSTAAAEGAEVLLDFNSGVLLRHGTVEEGRAQKSLRAPNARDVNAALNREGGYVGFVQYGIVAWVTEPTANCPQTLIDSCKAKYMPTSSG